ncbi:MULTISPECIES: PASTA domain-containing protein [unclassified Saccharopolyspora]|uniref:PASTA domain-containing protein n=1 Tax=unclassified Saccharopolyspora TaxID=2646250 RepID=UPI001CD3C6A9|nr:MULTISPECIES: PASTA domain-containing protein [unclassified Saccharopolyspora]MCA1189238.1 PASTA domain-containing protein [Saccharopolyspora sp. 6T]MCA1279491.1 PASTA domain-containing protein [Saccharopolyspora sp. 7B]
MSESFNTSATPPQSPQGMPPGTPPKQKAKKWPWIVGGIAVLVLIGAISSGGSTEPTAPAALPNSPAPATAVVDVTLPDLAGKNGQIALDELAALGLTAVTPASQDRGGSMVVLPANWTVVKIEPAPGTVVKSDSTVVVTMTKNGQNAATDGAENDAQEPTNSGIGDGTYAVGTDIEPGTYKSAGPSSSVVPMCYWARLKDTSGEFDSIIANNVGEGPATVTIQDGDGAFEVRGCQPFEKTG